MMAIRQVASRLAATGRRQGGRVPTPRWFRPEPLESRVLLSLSPADAAFRVNASTAGDQGAPDVAMDANGDSVFVWNNVSDYSTPDGTRVFEGRVFARLYDARGNAKGADIQVTPGLGTKGRVAMDADGDFAVLFVAGEGGESGVYARRFDARGVAGAGALRVDGGSAFVGNPHDFAIAMAEDGRFVAVWKEELGPDIGDDPQTLHAQLFDAAGGPVGPIIRVDDDLVHPIGDVSAAMAADGSFVVAWHADGGEGPALIAARRFDAAGRPTAASVTVVERSANRYLFGCDVAADPDGDFVVTWIDTDWAGADADFIVRARRYNAAGTSRRSAFDVDHASGVFGEFTSVAADATGGFAVAWQAATGYGTESEAAAVYTRQYDGTGAPRDGVNVVAAADRLRDLWEIGVAIDDAADRGLVTWGQNDRPGSDPNADTDIIARRLGEGTSPTPDPKPTPDPVPNPFPFLRATSRPPPAEYPPSPSRRARRRARSPCSGPSPTTTTPTRR